jgi:toxin YhaV
VIIYAWVNDEGSLRTYGAKRDAYAVFKAMLDKGNPPESWTALARAVGAGAETGGRGKKRRR